MTVPRPFVLADLPAGYQLHAGLGVATILPDHDVETYSPAGFVWAEDERWDARSQSWVPKAGWVCPEGASKKGLSVVGAAVYTEHPDADMLSLAYDLKDGRGERLWLPGMPLPQDYCEHIARGGLIEAHNAAFERWVSWNIMHPRYGFPKLQIRQQRCSMIKCRAWSLPPALGDAGDVVNLDVKKDKAGNALLKLFSVPQTPTKNQPKTRILPSDEPVKAAQLYAYNQTDIRTEAELSSKVPDLPAPELEYWFVDQAINARGVHVDRAGVEACIQVINQAHDRYNSELCLLTGGEVDRASKVARLMKWLGDRGVYTASLDEEAVDSLLARLMRGGEDVADVRDLDACRRALEIRAAVGSSSVKKVFAMRNQMTRADRLHDLFTGHGARTGRPTGNGPQPTNLPNSGPRVCHCSSCDHWYPAGLRCTWCNTIRPPTPAREGYDAPTDWNAGAAEDALQTISSGSLTLVETIWGDAMRVVSGVLRGLFTAAPGMELISSDYSAIEAVVNAALSGEQWRLAVFRDHGKIYEASAAAMFRIDVRELLEYPGKNGGSKHPLRAKGKVAELALGYLGWIGALRDMGGYDGTDQEAEELCKAWREANPNIVYLGGGQFEGRGWNRKPRLYGLEGMAIAAVQNPGTEYLVARKDGTQSGLSFLCHQDVLYLRLPSGRRIAYHRPRLSPAKQSWRGLSLSYEGYNTNPKNGPRGWIRMYTYAGKLLENACQAVANDILRYGQIALEHAGYALVLHVYDENIAEIPEGTGSIEQFERLMSTMPAWAYDDVGPWPIKARGGWRGKRYRK